MGIAILFVISSSTATLEAGSKGDMNGSQKSDWTYEEIITKDSYNNSRYPGLLISNDTIYVVWTEGEPDNKSDIFYQCKHITKANWEPKIQVSNNSDNFSAAWLSLAVHNEVVHVAWAERDNISDDWDIFYRNITGEDRSPIEPVSEEFWNDSTHPSLGVDSYGTVHIAWKDCTPNGNNDENDADIFYKNRTVQGNWNSIDVLNPSSDVFCYKPSLTVDDKKGVHVAWSDNFTGDPENTGWMQIYYQYKPYRGSWRDEEETITNTCTPSEQPFISAYNGTVYAVWVDYENFTASPDPDIFYSCKSLDNIWSTREPVSEESDDYSYYPSLAVDSNGTVHVTWVDWEPFNGSGEDPDIFYRNKSKNQDWGSIEVVSQNSMNSSYYPSVAVDRLGNIHFVWQDLHNYEEENDIDIIYRVKVYNNTPPQNVTLDTITDGKECTLILNTTDLEGQEVYYHIDWDDGKKERIGPFPSDEEASRNHTYSWRGTYVINVTAKDIYGFESDSTTRKIEIPFTWEPIALIIGATGATIVVLILWRKGYLKGRRRHRRK